MVNVHVTGGANYVECHVLNPLKEAGHNPMVYGDISRGFGVLASPHRVPPVDGNLSNRALLRNVLTVHHLDEILHYLGHAYINECCGQPDCYCCTNTATALALLEEAVAYRPDEPLAVILDHFSAAGTDHRNDCGIWHSPKTKLLTLAINSAMGGAPISNHGAEFETADGMATSEFVHVGDLSSARIAALDYPIAGGCNKDLDLGTGKGDPVQEIGNCAGRISRCKVTKGLGPRRLGDPPALVLDARKAKPLLNWLPHSPNLEQIGGDASSCGRQQQHIYGLARLTSVAAR
jgi:UDP-glucose 4-epimerase